jgi:hypothetical protein
MRTAEIAEADHRAPTVAGVWSAIDQPLVNECSDEGGDATLGDIQREGHLRHGAVTVLLQRAKQAQADVADRRARRADSHPSTPGRTQVGECCREGVRPGLGALTGHGPDFTCADSRVIMMPGARDPRPTP